MEDGGASSGIMIFIGLLLLEMLFYLFKTAMQYRKTADSEVEDGEESDLLTSKQKRVCYFSDHPSVYQDAIHLGIILIHLMVGVYCVPLVFSGLDSVQLLPVVLAVQCIMMAFGISVPRKIAMRNPDFWVSFLVMPIYIFSMIMRPLTWLLNGITSGLLLLFGIKNEDSRSDVTEEEILSMVNEGHEQGILHASEAEMINNIFEYGEKEAKDIMINRNNLVAMDCTMTLQEAAAFIVDAHNSRFPVYEGTIDHIVGILHLKDVMRLQMNEKMKSRPIGKIKGLLREPDFIPETRKLDDLFRMMQKEKMQMVIVIDEYGQTAGLVAFEDILEEIVGNIQDEYDEEETYIKESGTDSYVIQGMMPLEELEEILDVEFEDEPFDTVNGFVISRLEHIPEEGEEFEFDYRNYHFKILEVKDRMIQSVEARLNKMENNDMIIHWENTRNEGE